MLEAEIGNIDCIMNIDHVKIIVGCIYRMHVVKIEINFGPALNSDCGELL